MLAVPIEHLSNTGAWAAIFANIHIGGRQIDFLVATDSPTLVIEAKYFSRRVRGKVNGLWQMHVSESAWKNVGNPCVQALRCNARTEGSPPGLSRRKSRLSDYVCRHRPEGARGIRCALWSVGSPINLSRFAFTAGVIKTVELLGGMCVLREGVLGDRDCKMLRSGW